MAIKKCICKHEYQDKKYGSGMRVCNARKAKQGNRVIYRCTVCERDIG